MEPEITLQQFIERCIAYNEANNVDIAQLEVCPIHFFALKTSSPCLKTVQGIKECPLCHAPMCHECGRHNVHQISRVTGYMSTVQGWSAAKKQELIDRKRYNIKRGIV